MLLGSEECHTDKLRVFFEEFSGGRVGSFVDFGNEDECAASLEDAEDFAQVSGQVRPEVVRFHGSDDVEGVIRKRQPGDGGLPYFDPARLDPACICSLGESDAFFGIVNAGHFTLRCDRGQLVDGSPATTTHIKDGVVVRY